MDTSKVLILDMSMTEMNNKMGMGIRVNDRENTLQKIQMAAAVIKK